MNAELTKAVAAAETVLKLRDQLADAITATESQLPAAVESRLAAESTLSEAESDLAMGTGDQKTASAALKHLTSCREKLDSLSARLRGLRARLQGQESDLAAAYRDLNGLIESHQETAAREFEATIWKPAALAWSNILAQRHQLQSALGCDFDLQEPSPALCTSATTVDTRLTAPGTLLKSLAEAISVVGAAKQMAIRAARRKGSFDPDAIYQLRRTVSGYKAGTKVIGSQLGDAGAWAFSNGFLLALQDDESGEVTQEARSA